MNTVDATEIQNFSKDSSHWWDVQGPFRPLHRLNPVRLKYIKDQICANYALDPLSLKTYAGLDIIDVGCGGGLVCEPMARLGGNVTGLDADENAIAVAKAHAQENGLEIDYFNLSSNEFLMSPATSSTSSPPPSGDLETLGRMPAQGGHDNSGGGHDNFNRTLSPRQFDVVLALEIIEHVSDAQAFVKSLVDLCKPGGVIVISTLNRNAKSFALGIVAAEYILGWVPKGTHNWKKFVKPSELSALLRNNGATPNDICGLAFNPLKNEFHLARKDLDVNYLMSAKKN